jgi:hypothetical protein
MRGGSIRAGLLVIAGLLTTPAYAEQADPAPPPASLSDDLHHYFGGEKREGIAFMSVGAPAIVLGGALLAQDNEIGRGVAYPLLAIGVIELLAGVIVYTRTDRQVARLDAEFAKNPQAMRDAELKRMRRVNREFVFLKWLESSLMLSGVALAAVGAGTGHQQVLGAGLGLSLQSVAMLTFDGFAALRALPYTRSLERFQLAVSATPPVAATSSSGGTQWGFRLAASLCY